MDFTNLELAGSAFHFSFSSFCLLASAASSILLRSASWMRWMTLTAVLCVEDLAAHGGELLLPHRALPVAPELHLGVLDSPDNLADMLDVFDNSLMITWKDSWTSWMREVLLWPLWMIWRLLCAIFRLKASRMSLCV